MPNAAELDIPGNPEAFRQATIDATLVRIFDATIKRAKDRVAWYVDNGRRRAKWSKRLRILSLMLFAIGTIAPILATFLTRLDKSFPNSECWKPLSEFPWVELGFVLLALAGAVVIFDQFFGVSSSWLRFTQTQVRLEAMIEEFRYSWFALLAQSGGVVSATSGPADFVKLSREFIGKVQLLAQEETKEWADQYRAAIDKYDQNPDLKVKLGKRANNGAAAEGEDDKKQKPGGATATEGDTQPPKDNKPEAVTIRLAVDMTDLQDDSLAITLNDQPLADAGDGYAEVPLEVGKAHTFAARARNMQGKVVTGELSITPQPDDDNKPFELELKEG